MVQGLAKEHTCRTLEHGQQCVGMARGKGVGAGWRWAKGGKRRTSVTVSTIKLKLKKKIKRIYASHISGVSFVVFCS